LTKPAVHFVWFRGDEYLRAPRDTVVFARGGHDQAPSERSYADLPGVKLPV